MKPEIDENCDEKKEKETLNNTTDPRTDAWRVDSEEVSK